MEKKYLSEYEVMLATLKELGGDVNKNYASLYDVELAILKVVQEGGGGGGGGLTPEQVHDIVESYNYTTMQAVENKQFMKQKKLTLNGDEPLQVLDEDGNVLSYNDVKALVDNKALFVYMLVDNAFYIPCGDMVIPSGHNAVEFSSAFIVNGTANIARIIIDTADEVLYEQYILVDTDTLSGYATKDEIPSVEGLASEEYVNEQVESVRSEIPSLDGYATEQWVEDKNYATKDEIPSVEGLASTDYVDEQIQDTKNLIPSVEGLASETFVTEEIENNNETIAATYATKEEVAGAGMQMEVVDSLPETGAPKTIYLVPAKTATELNVKDEYVWVDGKWEVIGSTKINLEDYATIEYVDTVAGEIRAEIPDVSEFVTAQFVEGEIENLSESIAETYATKDEIPSVEGLASEQWVEDKGYLTEHQPLKTINGESIVGEGDIEIKGGGSSNVVNLTQAEYDELETKDPNTIYNITDAVNPYVKREELDDYATKQELAAGIMEAESYADDSFLTIADATENYATKQELAAGIMEAESYADDSFLTMDDAAENYATKQWVGENYVSQPNKYVYELQKYSSTYRLYYSGSNKSFSAILSQIQSHPEYEYHVITNDDSIFGTTNIDLVLCTNNVATDDSQNVITFAQIYSGNDVEMASANTSHSTTFERSLRCLRSGNWVVKDNRLATVNEIPYVPDTSNFITNVNGVSGIWSGTQSEYDAITSKDNTYLYIIKE